MTPVNITMTNFLTHLKESALWLEAALPMLAALLVVVAAARLYFRSRRQLVFEAWVNMAEGTGADLGRSVADLLLFKLRFVKSIHDQSARKLETWQPSQDMPAFRHGLDEDIKLLGSVELGKYGNVVSSILMILFRLVPVFLRPAQLRGSIHKYGDQIRLLATVEWLGRRRGPQSSTHLWEVLQRQNTPDGLPETVEELAYRIYLDLTGEDVFKSWEAFREYTIGLSHYLSWVDLQRSADFEEAVKHYGKALELEPNNPAANYNLAILKYFRWREADNRDSIKLFRGALNAPQSRLKARAHSGLANALLSQFHRYNTRDPHLLTDAVYHGRMAITLDPQMDGAAKAYAYACHQMSEFQETSGLPADRLAAEGNRVTAISHYRRAYEINPNHYLAHNNLANLYLEWAKRTVDEPLKRERLHSAIAECQAALKINPAFVFAHDNLANTYFALGRFPDAAASYKDALQYKPDYPEAKNDLARLHLEPQFDGFDVEQAFLHHRDALAAIKDATAQQEKLCRQFVDRVEQACADLTPENRDSLERLRSPLAELHCHCLDKSVTINPRGSVASRTDSPLGTQISF